MLLSVLKSLVNWENLGHRSVKMEVKIVICNKTASQVVV